MTMPTNRIKNALHDQPNGKLSSLGSPEASATAPGKTASTQQLFDAAWSLAKRDWEMNRLFNAWYYEI